MVMRPRALAISALVAVALALFVQTSHAQIPAEIVGVEWQWRGTLLVDGTIVRPADPSLYTLEFRADETAAVRADCNRGSGSYTTATNAMRIGPLATTLSA